MKSQTRLFMLLLVATVFMASSQKKGVKILQQHLESHYAIIPTSAFNYYGKTVNVNSFLICKTEVTNFEYLEFLTDLKANGELEKLAIAQIDTANWNSPESFNNKYVDYYHSHPAYRNFPVVNITKEGAELYCEWLSKKYSEASNGAIKLQFRLPNHTEWVRATTSATHANYAWNHNYLTTTDGHQKANYIRIGPESITRDSLGHFTVTKESIVASYANIVDRDYIDVTAPSKSYWPNEYDIYNMNGNVAEIIADSSIVAGGSWKDPGFDIRNSSYQPYTKQATNVGFRVVASIDDSSKELITNWKARTLKAAKEQ